MHIAHTTSKVLNVSNPKKEIVSLLRYLFALENANLIIEVKNTKALIYERKTKVYSNTTYYKNGRFSFGFRRKKKNERLKDSEIGMI